MSKLLALLLLASGPALAMLTALGYGPHRLLHSRAAMQQQGGPRSGAYASSFLLAVIQHSMAPQEHHARRRPSNSTSGSAQTEFLDAWLAQQGDEEDEEQPASTLWRTPCRGLVAYPSASALLRGEGWRARAALLLWLVAPRFIASHIGKGAALQEQLNAMWLAAHGLPAVMRVRRGELPSEAGWLLDCTAASLELNLGPQPVARCSVYQPDSLSLQQRAQQARVSLAGAAADLTPRAPWQWWGASAGMSSTAATSGLAAASWRDASCSSPGSFGLYRAAAAQHAQSCAAATARRPPQRCHGSKDVLMASWMLLPDLSPEDVEQQLEAAGSVAWPLLGGGLVESGSSSSALSAAGGVSLLASLLADELLLLPHASLARLLPALEPAQLLLFGGALAAFVGLDVWLLLRMITAIDPRAINPFWDTGGSLMARLVTAAGAALLLMARLALTTGLGAAGAWACTLVVLHVLRAAPAAVAGFLARSALPSDLLLLAAALGAWWGGCNLGATRAWHLVSALAAEAAVVLDCLAGAAQLLLGGAPPRRAWAHFLRHLRQQLQAQDALRAGGVQAQVVIHAGHAMMLDAGQTADALRLLADELDGMQAGGGGGGLAGLLHGQHGGQGQHAPRVLTARVGGGATPALGAHWPAPLDLGFDLDDVRDELGVDPPRGFVCPLTLDLFRQPALLIASNIAVPSTYEREAIQGWLADSRLDPKSRRSLPSNCMLVPNWDLGRSIDDWAAGIRVQLAEKRRAAAALAARAPAPAAAAPAAAAAAGARGGGSARRGGGAPQRSASTITNSLGSLLRGAAAVARGTAAAAVAAAAEAAEGRRARTAGRQRRQRRRRTVIASDTDDESVSDGIAGSGPEEEEEEEGDVVDSGRLQRQQQQQALYRRAHRLQVAGGPSQDADDEQQQQQQQQPRPAAAAGRYSLRHR